MTAATATPQVMRDRLLQAIDGQSNICNMVVVMEVISFLEKYPITKEALEETRLGKLINDVRKQTKNEDLAKRAKKLLRNWQKLIEPRKGEVLSKNHSGASWSSNGGAHPCVSSPAATTPSGKTVPELKNRNDFNNCRSLKLEKPNRKRKGGQKEGQVVPARLSKKTLNDQMQNSKQLSANCLGSCSDFFTDTHVCTSDKEISEPVDNGRLNKIPVNAVKPHPSALGFNKPPSTSLLLKASVLQQQQAASGGQYRPRSPRCSLHSPKTPKQEAGVKLQTPAQAQHLSSPAVRPGSVDAPGPGSSSQLVNIQGLHTDDLRSADVDSQSGHHCNFTPSSCSEDDGTVSNTGKRKKKYKPKDYAVNLEDETVEGSVKKVRLKDRRLTFDPVTGQIKSSFHRESYPDGDVKLEGLWSGHPKPNLNPLATPSPFQQTDWKELSRSEIIQSYLSQQSSVLTSSGAHTPGAHFFMTEFLKKEEHRGKDDKKTLVLAPDPPVRDILGVSREVTTEDLDRLHKQHWPGVNGCFDTKGHWYDWTDCISLDPHGDESRLNILPYVSLD